MSADLQVPALESYLWESSEYAERDFGEAVMIFRLLYEGKLLADRGDSEETRVTHKHKLRRVFHRQLSELWNTHPSLSPLAKVKLNIHDAATGEMTETTRVRELSRFYQKHGIFWTPLVNEKYGLVCSLKILFLRRAGDLVQQGDLDNRVKLLLDSLRMPNEANEIPRNVNAAEEPNPFFCLMSNDTLITHFSVKADTLLVPDKDPHFTSLESGAEPEKTVHLVIEVKTMIADASHAYIELGI